MGSLRRCVAAAAALAVVVSTIATPASASTGTKKPEPPPKHWDPRVKKIAAFVERDRGLEFEHPIRVDFLTDEAFRRKVRTDEDDVTAADRKDAAQSAGQLHALALIGADVDLIGASSDLDEFSIVGYFDTELEVMVIRGKDLTDVEVRVTVAHELVHALQDQHYNLDKLYNTTETSGEAFALDVLIEGDASLIEIDYISTLSNKQQDEYYGEGASADENAEDAPGDAPLPEGVPVALDLFSSVPYVLGPSFVYLLSSIDGRELDRAFEDPPVTDEDIMDPVAWADHKRPDRVAAPKLTVGESKAGPPDEFGAFTLYLMLAARTDVKTALRAATGWGGDRYRGFERDGRQCIRAAFVGDTGRDTDEIEAALGEWAATLPPGMATVSRGGGVVELTSCEDDTVEAPEAAALEEAVYTTLDLRITLAADFVGGFDASVKAARCSADRFVTDPALVPIVERIYYEGVDVEDLAEAEQKTFYTRSGRHFQACGVPIDG